MTKPTLDGPTIAKLKKTQAFLKQSKAGISNSIAEIDGLVTQWGDEREFDSQASAMNFRSELRDALSVIDRAHAAAGQKLVQNFENGGDVVSPQGGGGR